VKRTGQPFGVYPDSFQAPDGITIAVVTHPSAEDGELIRVVPMEGEEAEGFVRSSVVAAHGQLYVRTTKKLYCIGN
jgi:hypothetical protein